MNLLNLEDDKFKTVKVKGYSFKIRAMFPKDKIMVAQRRMGLQNGNPVEALTSGDFNFFENIAIIDVCVEEMPKELKANESCVNWIDQELINLLAEEIKSHTLFIEGELKKNKPVSGIEKE